MSIDFEHTIEIDRPAAEVFEFVSDFENNPRWQKGQKSARWTSEQSRAVDATYVQEASFMGRSIDTHFRVSEFIEGERISIESTVSTFPLQITRSVTALGADRCRAAAHIRGQPTGFFRLFPSALVKSAVKKDYAALKALLET